MGDTTQAPLKGKAVVFGISGGIAAYKAPLIVRGLMSLGFQVDCLLTEAAQHFVTPLALQSLTGRAVYTRMIPIDFQQKYQIEH
jgi:phosphopantothenoylcysteine decarboxylase / phosphopantothenate---cysteine ligase